MQNALRVLAQLANGLFFCGVIVAMAENSPYGIEYLWFFLLLAYPVANFVSLYNSPDFEERKLRRKVAKAELRKRLKDLGEN